MAVRKSIPLVVAELTVCKRQASTKANQVFALGVDKEPAYRFSLNNLSIAIAGSNNLLDIIVNGLYLASGLYAVFFNRYNRNYANQVYRYIKLQ